MTRRAAAALAALLLTAAACSAGDSVLRAAPGSGQGSVVPTSGGAGGFPEPVVAAYLDGCAASDEELAYCRCTIEQFEQRLTLEEFLAIDDLEGGVVLEVAAACMDQAAGPAGSEASGTVLPGVLRSHTDATVADVEAYWADTLPALYGTAYRPVEATVPYFPSTGDLPGCGPEPLPPELYPDNAFYCSPGDYVAWDAEGLMPGLYTEFGDFAVALVLAHEWGHVAQDRAGIDGPGIMLELQADCFAGAWARHVEMGESALALRPGDLDEAVAGYLLFRDPPGTSPAAPDAHGSAFDRVLAFQEGFFDGEESCTGYPEGDFTVVDIPLTREDLITGGDLPFADTAPVLIATLESYWSAAYPQVFGGAYRPMTDYGPYLPSTGILPPCEGLEPDDYPGNAFYCPGGDYVAWDNETLFPSLWQEIGDLGVGMVLAHEWATAVQARAGLPLGTGPAALQADCFTGSWAGAMVGGIPITLEDGTETSIRLSAGDLDEAVAGFLLFAEEAGPMSASAFARFDAFQRGFFDGAGGCLAFSE